MFLILEEVIARRYTHKKGDRGRKKHVSKIESVRFVSGVLSRDKGIIESDFVEYYNEHFSFHGPKKDGFHRFYLHLMPRFVGDLQGK